MSDAGAEPTPDSVAALVTAALTGVPGVSAVYAKRGVAGSLQALRAAVTRAAPVEPRASVTITGSTATVEATIGVSGRSAGETAEAARATVAAAVAAAGLTAGPIKIRVATVD